MMGFFGGDKKYTTTATTTIAQDQRVQVGGSAGPVISPGAAVAGGAAVSAAPYSTVNQTITSSGMASSDLRTLLDDVLGQQTEQLSSLGSSMGASTRQLADIIGATRAPEQSLLTGALPWLVLVVFLLLVLRK